MFSGDRAYFSALPIAAPVAASALVEVGHTTKRARSVTTEGAESLVWNYARKAAVSGEKSSTLQLWSP